MGETKIGTRINGSIIRRPGKSVLIIRKARIPPSGIAITTSPVARIKPLF
ncbi:hypothetical protein YPPY54_3595, partial [Yersinia pestis PY-54]